MMNTLPISNNTTVTKHREPFVPFVPLAVSSALVAVLPLSKRLAAHTPQFAHLSRSEFDRIGTKKLALLDKVNECSQTTEALIDVNIDVMNQLFYGLALSLQFEGQRQEAASMSESDPLDVVLQDKYAQLDIQAMHARDEVVAMLTQLGLQTQDIYIDDQICPGKLLDACRDKLGTLQQRWKDNYLQVLELSLQLQSDFVYGAVADCLTDICQFGLHEQLSLEPVPQAQEAALVAMSNVVDLPFAGTWPVLVDLAKVVNTEAEASVFAVDSTKDVGDAQ